MNIRPITCNSFKGIYLSNALAPGYQRDQAKEIMHDFVRTGLDMQYENEGKDILITPSPDDECEIELKFVPHSLSRILDDDYSRWNGRLY